MMDTYIKITNLLKTYIKDSATIKALDIKELTIPEKGLIFVTGHSGAGKTTLLNIIGLLDVPTSGQVCIDGKDTTGFKEEEKVSLRQKCFGFIFQSCNLIPTLTVEENILLPLFPYGVNKQSLKETDEILEKFGLLKRRRHLPSELSGGEQQRAAIARALINNPKIILADEPTANLDPQNSKLVLDFLFNITLQKNLLLIIAGNDIISPNNQSYRQIQLLEGKVSGNIPQEK